jgi:putative MATE family efflux protein
LNKLHLKRLWLLVLPILGESFLSLCVGWSDTILTARALPEDKYIAAVTFCSYVYWLIDCFGYFASIGVQTLISQYIGAGKHKRANEVLLQGMLIALFTGLLLLSVVWLATDSLKSFIPLSKSAQDLVVEYLRILGIAYPLMMLLQVGCAAMQATGHTFNAMCVMGLANLINIIFSWGLATGFEVFPPLGWAGIAAGTSISLTIAGLFAIYWLFKGVGCLRLSFELPKPHFVLIKKILQIGIPGACNWLLMTVGYLWHLVIIGRLGDTAVAAHGVAVWCESLSWLVGNAFSIAAATLIGQSLGAKRPDLARRYGWLALYVGGLFMCALGVIFYCGAPALLKIFLGNEHQEVLVQGTQVLQLIAFAQPAAAAATILSWALEGGAGDTKFALTSSLLGKLVVEIPLAYALTGVLVNLGLFGAWLALLVNHYIQGIAATVRFSSPHWVKLQI